ncbi:MAG: AMP-binding protein [Candidatus Krumholzibacteriia bacterium]
MSASRWRPYLDLHADDPFWTDADGTLSRGALGAAVDARARELQAAGWTEGRRYPLEAVPTRGTLVTLLGALAAGCSVVLLPLREPAARRRELAAALDIATARPGQLWVRTSGTGGRARWLVHSPSTLMAAAEAATTRVGFGRGSAWRVSLPLDHVGGLSLVWRALVSGGGLVAVDHPTETHRSLVPTQLHRALVSGAVDELRRLRCLLLGGAPLPASLREAALAAGLPLRVSYGLTETGAFVAASLPGDPLLACADYVGRPLWPSQLAISAGGEVLVAGPSLAAWQADDDGHESTLTLDAEGWLATGDLGRLAGDALYVSGRRDNLIISGGEKLAAEELEAALLSLPGVLEAVVVAVEHAEFGQRPVAFLTCEDAAAWTVDRVREALRDHLAAWKLPDRVLDLPRGDGLKADRAVLRRLAREG